MQSKRDQSTPQPLRDLTDRERQIVWLVCPGHTNKVIARKLQVREGTIKSHLHAIYLKLGIKNRADLTALFATVHNDKLSSL